MPKVFIHLGGGLVQDVCSDVAGLEIIVLDFDIEPDDEGAVENPETGDKAFMHSEQASGELWSTAASWLDAFNKRESVKLDS